MLVNLGPSANLAGRRVVASEGSFGVLRLAPVVDVKTYERTLEEIESVE